MDQATIISMAVFIFTNIGTIIAMFIWNRSESNADRREMDSKFNTLIEAVHEEMKDFHGRLCSIEERNRK